MHEPDERSATILSDDLSAGRKPAIVAEVAGSFTYASYQFEPSQFWGTS